MLLMTSLILKLLIVLMVCLYTLLNRLKGYDADIKKVYFSKNYSMTFMTHWK